MDELDYSYCHIDEYADDDFSCLDYMECEECPYYYEDDEYTKMMNGRVQNERIYR